MEYENLQKRVALLPNSDIAKKIALLPKEDIAKKIALLPKEDIAKKIALLPNSDIAKKIALLPNEIQFTIMSYSMSPQPPALCHDIKHYYKTLLEIFIYYHSIYIDIWHEEEPEDKHWLINDIYAYMNDYYPTYLGYRESFANIMRRSFIYRNWISKTPENTINKYIATLNRHKVDYEIYMIWGILTPEERNHFMNYAVKDMDLAGENLLLIAEQPDEENE